LADRITRTIVAPIEVGGREVLVGSSIGIAVAPFDGTSAEALLRNADLALYRAKSEGRGGYCFFELGMDEALQHRRTLEQGLRAACARREFQLFYQPIVNLKTGRICGFEALLRWERPGLGPISPLEFVPIAEELGIINQIGGWALTEACRTAARWPADIRIAVNLSASQFKSREVVDQVITALAESGLGPERLEIEITESLLLSDTALTLEILHQLRQLGIRIAMDDFGTGYSSLRYLRAFPFDKIKIDRSFINGVATEGDAATIVSAVINLSRSLGMTTVAEGIETEAELEAVRAQGCQEAQGFLFSPALPARAVEMLARSDWTTAVAVPSAIGFRSRPQAPRNSTNL
jgi:predicted signal transduction protein with EAL and GGDEF domain